MPNFTAPVGDMVKNEVHDVALLQGAFLILKTHKRLNFWDGPVDGDWRRHQQSLTEALKKLEAEAKITNGPGRIEPGGPLARKLKQLLPTQYQSLAAIPGTACLTIQDPFGGQHKGPALKDLALHDQCRKDLERLIKAGADRLGLTLVIDKEETDHKGRCVFTLKPHGVKCLDARLNPLAPGAPTPRPMIEAVAKHAAQATTLDVPPHGTKLEVKTRQAQRMESRRAKDERLKHRAEVNSERAEKERLITILKAQFDELEAMNEWAWAEIENLEVQLEDVSLVDVADPASHIRSGTVGGTYKLMLRLKHQGLNLTQMQAAFAKEIASYRAQINQANFDPRGVSIKLEADFKAAMIAATDHGSHISKGVAVMHEKYGRSLPKVLDGIAVELYQKYQTSPVTFDGLDGPAQTAVEREALARMGKSIGNLKSVIGLGGIANGGFVLLTAFVAIDSAQKAENFYGELNRQAFNITATEAAVKVASRLIPRILTRLGLNIATKPVPHLVVAGAILIVLSFAIGQGVDVLTSRSGIFEDLFRVGRRSNHVQRRREQRKHLNQSQ